MIGAQMRGRRSPRARVALPRLLMVGVISTAVIVAGTTVGIATGAASATAPLSGEAQLTVAEQQMIAKELGAVEQAEKQVDEALARPVDQRVLGPLHELGHQLGSDDLEAVMTQVERAKAAAVDEELKHQIETFQHRNALMKDLNANLAKAMKAMQDKDVATTQSLCGTAEQAKCVQQLKSQIDQLSTDSQMDMLRIQSLVNKRNQAFEGLVSLILRWERSRAAIIGTMR